MKIHTMKECVSLYFHLGGVKSIGLFPPHWERTVIKASHIEQYIDILEMKWANTKQFNIVLERQ